VPIAHLEPKEYLRQVPPESVGCSGSSHSESEALEYTRWLATHHYENFHVVSFLLPKKLHQDFYNIYAFCRWADDLGDEIGDVQESLHLLAWWRHELEQMYRGQASHPVFVALRGTVQRHAVPIEPFDRLIRAFEQDQAVSRYQTFNDVFGYCINSANPVGHLVLYLCGYRDRERQQLSDCTCTALQLANFWQDFGRASPGRSPATNSRAAAPCTGRQTIGRVRRLDSPRCGGRVGLPGSPIGGNS